MHKAQLQVQEFHRDVLEGPTSPAEPKVRNPELRARLILEEAVETVVALVGGEQAYNMVREAGRAIPQRQKPSLLETIDGIVDTIYVCYGTAEDIGVDLEPFFDEVHAANMRKRDPERAQQASKSPLGKVIKPPGWKGPDIAGVLARVTAHKLSREEILITELKRLREVEDLIMASVQPQIDQLKADRAALDVAKEKGADRLDRARKAFYELARTIVRDIGEIRKLPTREQRIDFAYGNCKLSNPDVTREMVERAVDEIDAEKAK